MKRKIVLIISWVYSGLLALGQTPNLPTIVPASPEASAIAKYINYPVNYGTGLVDITIPLYEISVGDLTLPISLSYHASGIKVNENSGWVGLGWTLNAEPTVSRSIKGLADERGYLKNTIYGADDAYYKVQLANGDSHGFDEQPDEFYYKLLTKSGGFFINKQPRTNNEPTFVVHPYEPIEINEKYISDVFHNRASEIDTFKIVDDNGVKYSFGDVETSSKDSNNPGPTFITSWKATTVASSATSNEISFQYQPGRVEFTHSLSDQIVVKDSAYAPFGNMEAFVRDHVGCASGGTSLPLVKEYVNGTAVVKRVSYSPDTSGQLITTGCWEPGRGGGSANYIFPKRIQEINFGTGKVTFEIININKHGDCLNKIIVFDNNDKIIKQFRFFYSSYVANATRNRVLLDSIDVLDRYGVVVEEYEFQYTNDPVLPDYLSKSIDFWGYYNGAPNDYFKSLVPQTQISSPPLYPFHANHLYYQIGHADRSSNFYYSRAFTLAKITYPTKGYTEFEYQPNQYKEGNVIKNSGGLRIYKIKDFPLSGQRIERVFKYGKDEDGAGFVKRAINADSYSCEQIDAYDTYIGFPIQTVRSRIFYSDILHDLFYSQGSPVVYDQVTEYQVNQTDTLGKTVYNYNYKPSTGYSNYKYPGTTFFADHRDGWMFGELISKKIYSWNKSTEAYSLQSSMGYRFGTVKWNQSTKIGRAYRRKNLFIELNRYRYSMEDIYYVYNYIYTGANVLLSDTITHYENSGSIEKINHYSYSNSHVLSPTRIETTDSDGTIHSTINKYPHDLLLSGNEEAARVKLIEDGRVSTLLEQIQEAGEATTKTRTNYSIFNEKAQPSSVVMNTGLNGTDEVRQWFDAYDNHGNLLQYHNKNDINTSFVWGYNHQYPIAKVINAECNRIAHTSFEQDATDGWIISSSISTYPLAAKTGSCSAYLGYFKSITSPVLAPGNYVIEFFAKPSNSQGTSTIFVDGASFLISGEYKKYSLNKVFSSERSISLVGWSSAFSYVDEVRIYPVDSQMTTYTYNPLLGMTSQTDANGMTTYYEYDSFGRLNHVKDNDGYILQKHDYHYAD